jgi:hypothetical protein
MALHQAIQRLLLIGLDLRAPDAPPAPRPPPELLPLIGELRTAHRTFDERAIHFGHRYRSGFWSIYVLSAVAVLFAVVPLALGWDSQFHRLHPYAGAWAVGEVFVITTVIAIYWQGNRRDWQGQWLSARTTAELTWYLPVLAPLVELGAPSAEANWYLRVFDPGNHVRSADEIATLCNRIEPLARKQLADAWSNPAFVEDYAQWTIGLLAQQQHYHRGITIKQHALLHRVHAVNGYLFGLTAIGAMMHLVLHTLWLSLVTTFFPALGASLHGALAQSEAYRLGTTSERLVGELGGAIERIRSTVDPVSGRRDVVALKAAIEAAIALILEEHQDWNLLVRPHNLPLA